MNRIEIGCFTVSKVVEGWIDVFIGAENALVQLFIR